jgi:hypothetical protein
MGRGGWGSKGDVDNKTLEAVATVKVLNDGADFGQPESGGGASVRDGEGEVGAQ